ncbi:hypothetical protein OQA88_3928 [Cercophora sp. LCS_1]
MSNVAVGSVYEHIINEVINSVRVDFEENGVDDGVLEELKKGWQHKLSQLSVAQFPWDPKEQPQQPAAAPQNAAPPVPVPPPQPVANYTQSTLSPQTAAQPLHQPIISHPNGNGIAIKSEPNVRNDPPIKQEPGLGGGQGPMHYAAPSAPRGGAATAAQRAAEALQNQYGHRAAASISAIQSGMGQQGPRPGQLPQQMMPQQYRQGVPPNMQQRLQPQQPHVQQTNGLPTSQMDGPSDGFEGVLMQRGADGRPVEMGRVEIDNIIHAQMAARAKEMEGGGLMLPLREATRHRSRTSKKAAAGPSQVDGPDDDFKDEDLDDDAINSDLDDPDDARDDDDDDEEMSHMMLCMYDKVQRVKNKWKCTLKDGVLTVNNREYVFHKATGEYEW